MRLTSVPELLLTELLRHGHLALMGLAATAGIDKNVTLMISTEA